MPDKRNFRNDFDDIPACTEYQRDYEPTPAHRAVYDTAFRELVNAYQRNKAIFRRLKSRR